MNGLAKLLSSKVRAEIFRLLFGVRDLELHVRELARRSHHNEASVRQELKRLKDMDLVEVRRETNRAYYRANRQHPLHAEIHGLVLKTSGLVDVIRERLAIDGVQWAFVFGSVARGEETGWSDVDLMLIGDVGLRKLTSLLGDVSDVLGRQINPHILSRDDYRRRLARSDHFVVHVLSGPKVWVVGDSNEFEAMAGERLAQA